MIISPRSRWLDVNLEELWHYRDLIFLFVRRDFVAIYKQTVLGPIWFLLQPLFSTIVYTIVFGKIANIPTDGMPPPLFYMSGIVVWNYFASCLSGTSNTFVDNASIFGKVYFPRLAVPIAIVITNLMTFIIQFSIFLSFLLFYYLKGAIIKPNLLILLAPFLILQMGMLGLGFGIIVSSLTTKYRDLKFAITIGIQLWMYATPIIYPMSQIPEHWRWLFALNPMSVIIELFRCAFLGTGSVKPLVSRYLAWQLRLPFWCRHCTFQAHQRTFMDTV